MKNLKYFASMEQHWGDATWRMSIIDIAAAKTIKTWKFDVTGIRVPGEFTRDQALKKMGFKRHVYPGVGQTARWSWTETKIDPQYSDDIEIECSTYVEPLDA